LFTASAPLPAALSELSATLEESPAFFDTSIIDCAICVTAVPAPWISTACFCAASRRRVDTVCASCVAERPAPRRR
jgi:hypothetical protein